jgi:hypothetical protein
MDKNISALFGIIGAILLAIPAGRQEIRRKSFSDFLEAHKNSGKDDRVEAGWKLMITTNVLWDLKDSLFTFLGLFCLLMAFILELF